MLSANTLFHMINFFLFLGHITTHSSPLLTSVQQRWWCCPADLASFQQTWCCFFPAVLSSVGLATGQLNTHQAAKSLIWGAICGHEAQTQTWTIQIIYYRFSWLRYTRFRIYSLFHNIPCIFTRFLFWLSHPPYNFPICLYASTNYCTNTP